MIENHVDRTLFKSQILKKGVIVVLLLSLSVLVQPGTSALYPSFYAMNQANMTLVVSDNFSQDNIAYGDFLYLYDTTTASAGDSINTKHWNITLSSSNAYSGPRDSYVSNPVFGPFFNETAIIVNLTVTNSTLASFNGTDVYQVIDGRDWIRPSYSVNADYKNKTPDNPNGTVTFNDTSVSLLFPMNEVSQWWWKATNDAGVSRNVSGCDNFTLTLSNTKSYTVNLTVRNDQGNLASYTGYTGIPPDDLGLIPNYAAVPIAGSAPLNVSFIDQSSGDVVTWNWDFDVLEEDPLTPHTSFDKNPAHTYTKPGSYSVGLSITDNFSTVSFTGAEITVYAPPAPKINFAVSPTKGDKPLNVTVISQSTGLNQSPIYEWNFGNGTTINSTVPSCVYTYDPAGVNPSEKWNYTVSHTVYSDGIAYPASYTQNVTVETPAPPRARFTAIPKSGPAPLEVSFIDQSEGREPLQYEWNFDDGKPNNYDQNPNVTFGIAKVYNVTLRLDAANGFDQTYMNINVTDPVAPFVDFAVSPTKGYNPLNVTVIAQCTGLNDTPVFEWDFGNGTKECTTDWSYVYQYKPSSPDPHMVWEYPINLTVYSDGETYCAPKNRNVTVENPPKPKAAFNAYPRNGSAPLEVAFFDQSVGQEPIKYEWYFGDDTPKELDKQNPIHVFNETGEFNVTLMIHASNGEDIINQTGFIRVTDYPIPNVSFSMAPLVGFAPLKVSFIDQTCKQDCSYEYFWQFGDGNTSTKKNPVWEYVTPGNYPVNLTVTDKYGVSKKAGGDVNVTVMQSSGGEDGPLVANFTALSPRGVAPFEVHFFDLSTGMPDAWKWNFSDGEKTYDKSPNHTFVKPGIYNVTLEVYNKTSYSSNITKNDYITAISPIIDAWFSFRYIGDQSSRLVQFNDGSIGVGINSWEWTFGDGDVSTERNPAHLFNAKGIYNVKLFVSNGYAEDIFTYKVYI